MKKYTKPTCEAMSLGLKGEMLQVAIADTSNNAIQLDSKIDGGDALVKEERDWTDSSNFWGE